jgi:hypothetical protein
MTMKESTASPAAVMTLSSNVRIGCYREDWIGFCLTQSFKNIHKKNPNLHV